MKVSGHLISNTRMNLVHLWKVSSFQLRKCLQPVGQPELATGIALENSGVRSLEHLLSSAQGAFSACGMQCCAREFLLGKRSAVMGVSSMREA